MNRPTSGSSPLPEGRRRVAVIFRSVVLTLEILFTALLMLTIMFAGLIVIFKPERGRDILKNAAIAAGLFLLGLTIARACADALR